MSAVVDTRAFDSAFKQYLAATSKTMDEAVNWKAADLMFKAAQETPKSKLTGSQFRAMMRNPQLISYRTGRRFGNADGKGWTRNQWEEVRNSMAARRLGKGFMRSAFIKAGAQIPRTVKGKRSMSQAENFTRSRADVRLATGKAKEVAARLVWMATNQKDATLKQEIVDAALAKAFPAVAASMVEYLRRKNGENARKVSA